MSCHAGPYNRGIVTKGLVLYYDVNEPVCYSSGRTDIQDLGRNGNSGTLVNGVGYSANNGGTLVFDKVDDYINIPYTFNTNTDFTYNFWNSVNGTVAIHTLLSSPTQGEALQIRYDTNKQIQLVKNRVVNIGIFSGFTASANANYLITVSQNKTSNTFNLYVNGSYQSSINSPQTFVLSYSSLGYNYGTSEYFGGTISSFSYYNRELSATEILQNFNAHKDRFGL